MDFTIKTYKQLLESLQNAGFSFLTFAEYITKPQNSSLLSHEMRSYLHRGIAHRSPLIILRHDVDALPKNSLRFARIQAEMGIKGTYYFRAVPQSWNEDIIKEIAALGHEVGYHYENMDTVSSEVRSQRSEVRGLPREISSYFTGVRGVSNDYNHLLDLGYEDFQKNLEKLRQLVPVSTISMHGSPLSKYDNRDIWKKYDYKKLGILAEPYFDIDFNQLFYLTDTGRCWDGHRFNVRDKATKENPITNPEFLKLRFHSTNDLINAINKQKNISTKNLSTTNNEQRTTNTEQRTQNNEQIFPSHVMLNFHPQRWHSKPIPWLKQFIWQNAKNQAKRVLIAARRQREVKL